MGVKNQISYLGGGPTMYKYHNYNKWWNLVNDTYTICA